MSNTYLAALENTYLTAIEIAKRWLSEAQKEHNTVMIEVYTDLVDHACAQYEKMNFPKLKENTYE